MTYKVIIDHIEKEQWEQYAKEFADYSIYQTWPYQQVRTEMDGQELSRVVVEDENDRVVMMGHIRIKRIKPLGLKVGYMQWGPLIRGMNGELTCSVAVLEKLWKSYLGSKVNILRIVPNLPDDNNSRQFTRVLELNGFEYVQSVRPYHTLLLSLDGTEEDLRQGFSRSGRRNLKKAEKACIRIEKGISNEYFSIFERLYAETLQRKGFKGLNLQEFMRMQSLLSSSEKINIIVGYYENQPVSSHVTSHLGNTAVNLFTASNSQGLKIGASHLVWWESIIAAKRAGMKYYDFGGVDPESNPTVYEFKRRMGGQKSFHVGAFEACSSLHARIIWRTSERIYNLLRK